MEALPVRVKSCFALFLLFCLTVSAACAGRKVRVENLSSVERAKLANMQVFSNNPFAEGSYIVLGTATGTSCKRNAYGQDASSEEAESDMRIKASLLGADAVVNVVIQDRGVSWSKNCWQTIVAVGDAIHMSTPEPPRPAPPSASSSSTPIINAISLGTGWIANPCLIVTNFHVIEGYSNISARLQSGQKIALRLAQKDPVNDLAILVPINATQLPSALPLTQNSARIGARVFTMGFPHPDVMGAAPKLTDGIINASTGIQDDPRYYQMSVPIQSGNSGGPVLNMRGEVIGIATSKLNAAAMLKFTGDLIENVGYALKLDYLHPLTNAARQSSNGCTALIPEESTLEVLADRIKPSVVLIIAE
ncbi:MAG: trypsin-like peptidase domain-containing protein [Deltaproteobacteria bacterium]|nr:trypsin-like peptidase domain-containing protein [Deltaproteobacteria bacterium]